MAIAATSPPESGQLVNVRSRRWVVNEVQASQLSPRSLEPTASNPQHLVSLLSVGDDSLGEELQVVWEIEPGAKLIEKVALPEPTGFDSPDRLDAFLDAVRWGAASTADPIYHWPYTTFALIVLNVWPYSSRSRLWRARRGWTRTTK